MIEVTVDYANSNIQQAAENAGLESGTIRPRDKDIEVIH